MDFDARPTTYYWLQNRRTFEIPEVGVQAEYRDDFKIVSFCNFDFTHFPFETLICNVTYRLYDLSILYYNFKSKPEIYFGFDNKKQDLIPIETNIPYDITAKAIELFTLDDSGIIYSATGVKFILKRNDLGLLMSRFYGPMACFAVLAMLSYNINIDVVNISFHLKSKKETKHINLSNLCKTSTGGRTNGHDNNIVLDFIQRL